MGRFQLSGLNRVRRTLIGQPLPTSAHAEERLSNAEALAILLAGYAHGWPRRLGGFWPPFVLVALLLLFAVRF